MAKRLQYLSVLAILLALSLPGIGSIKSVRAAELAEPKMYYVLEIYVVDPSGAPVQGASVRIMLNTGDELGPEPTGNGNGRITDGSSDSGWAKFVIPAGTGQSPYPAVVSVEVESWLAIEVAKYPNLGVLPVWSSPGTVTAVKIVVGHHPAGTPGEPRFLPTPEPGTRGFPPSCMATAEPMISGAPANVVFDGSFSGDVDDSWGIERLNPRWDITGPGIQIHGSNLISLTLPLQQPGDYLATLTVVDSDGNASSCDVIAQVLPAPDGYKVFLPGGGQPEPTPTPPAAASELEPTAKIEYRTDFLTGAVAFFGLIAIGILIGLWIAWERYKELLKLIPKPQPPDPIVVPPAEVHVHLPHAAPRHNSNV